MDKISETFPFPIGTRVRFKADTWIFNVDDFAAGECGTVVEALDTHDVVIHIVQLDKCHPALFEWDNQLHFYWSNGEFQSEAHPKMLEAFTQTAPTIFPPTEATAAEIGTAFIAGLQAALTKAEFAEMIYQNRSHPPTICASYDFCDANEMMQEAMRECGVTLWRPAIDQTAFAQDAMYSEAVDLLNEAWIWARNHMLDIQASL